MVHTVSSEEENWHEDDLPVNAILLSSEDEEIQAGPNMRFMRQAKTKARAALQKHDYKGESNAGEHEDAISISSSTDEDSDFEEEKRERRKRKKRKQSTHVLKKQHYNNEGIQKNNGNELPHTPTATAYREEKYGFPRINKPETNSVLHQKKTGIRNIQLRKICIACQKSDNVDLRHPLFRGGMCQQCFQDWRDVAFALAPEGETLYCLLCSNPWELITCSQACGASFCTGCIRDFLDTRRLQEILNTGVWTCFLCAPYSEKTHGLLHPREGWKVKLQTLCQPDNLAAMPVHPSLDEKRPIRVLSLFDGIGTGRVILHELGIEVEKYYACEVDKDALAVSQYHHPDIIHLGDVTNVDIDKLKEIGPIDLLIGGSPCADLSLVNPQRKGFGGQGGSLFFEYFRIWSELPHLFKERNLFWLFENTSSMEVARRAQISRYFHLEHAIWDAACFTAMKRARYFWGNLPTIYCPYAFAGKQVGLRRTELQDVMMGNNRRPLLPTVKTVTTNSNSVRGGQPTVSYNGVDDYLWITELERLFGFPAHYTDIAELNIAKRQKLVGKSWCIAVVKHLLYPLRRYYNRCTKKMYGENPQSTKGKGHKP